VLRYSELHVSDADGRVLKARLAVSSGLLTVVILDTDTVYPIVVDPLLTSPAWTAESDQAGAEFGVSVATAGDVNGDGFSDVIVGAPGSTNGQVREGRAYVYHGSAAGLSTRAAWTAESNRRDAFFGCSAAAAGDVNGDGFSDVIVGACHPDNGQADEGGSVVYHGSAAGLSTMPAWMAEGDQVGAEFGNSVATAGDVNGDGFSDVVVGAHHYSNGQDSEGRASVYFGSAAGLSTAPAWVAEGDQADAGFGGSVATAGDVNGDGFSDVVVGAHHYSNGPDSEGRASVYFGSAAGLSAAPAWVAEGDQADAGFGGSVAAAGDLNGDGFSDLIVGASHYTNGEGGEGRAFAYYGNEGDGLDRIPRQARADDTAPIDILGKSDSSTSFRLKALGRTPLGRGNVRLEWEVKPIRAAFDGTGLQNGAFADTGAPVTDAGSAVPLDELTHSLPSPGPVYHWRLRIAADPLNPFFPRSPWFTMPYNNRTETDLRVPPPLSACFGATPNPADCNELIVFDGSCSAGVIVQYQWDWEDDGSFDLITGSPTATHPYGARGTYMVRLRVIGDGVPPPTSETTRTIEVVDTVAPTLTCPADATLEVDGSCQAAYSGPSATATDNCDGSPTVTSVPPLPAIYTGVGDHTISWTATDDSGNSSTCVQTITIIDVTVPVLVGVPEDMTVECDSVPEPAAVTALDNCDPSPDIVYSQARTDGDCQYNYTLSRTWTATDDWGNFSTGSHVITVQDTEAPQLRYSFDPVYTDEDPDEEIDGLYRIRYSGRDNCDPNPRILGFLDIYGADEHCDEAPDEHGFPVEDGDIVRLNCGEKDWKKWGCVRHEESDEVPEGPVVVLEITGPAMKLTVTGVDACANESLIEGILRCPEPGGCISAITLENANGERKTFYWWEFSKHETLFDVGGETGEFRTDCSGCVMVGDISGTLRVLCIEAGKKLARKCRVPEDTFSTPCP
jgi:hypothetical protein